MKLNHSARRVKRLPLAVELIHTRRLLGMLEQYISRLQLVLSNELGKLIELTNTPHTNPDKVFTDHFGPNKGSYISAHLRVFQENLAVILPTELVEEIISSVFQRKPKAVLNSIGDEHIGAMSYFIARLLSEEQMFAHQRVYLTSLHVSGTREDDTYLDKISEKALQGEVAVLEFEAGIEASSYSIPVVLSLGLCKRLRWYSRLFARRGSCAPILEHIATRWSIMLNIEIGSLASLLNIKPGERIPLTRASGVLSQLKTDNKEKDKQTSLCFPVRLLPMGRRGFFRLEIT